MTIPKIVINARPVTTIVLSNAVTTQARPHSACGGTETIPVPTAVRPASAFSSLSGKETDEDAADSNARTSDVNMTETELQSSDTVAPEEATFVAAQTEDMTASENMDTETEMTQTAPDITITDSLTGQTDFLDALAHLDASTGNLPVADDYEQIERQFAANEFDKEDSPDVVEI